MFSKLKKLGASYIAFGIGTIFGSIVASVVGTMIYQVVNGNEDAAKILQITECLEERAEK
jgi:large-conductance mechanosensitive channel